MAEKQFALGASRSAGFQEDDDPLAELARIVGFQDRPDVRSPSRDEDRREPVVAEFPGPAAQASPAAPAGANPVADLEDELLRAFETYDSPRAEAAAAEVSGEVRAETVRVEPVPASAPVSDIDEDQDPFAALAAVVARSESVMAPAARPAPVSPPASGISPAARPASERIEPAAPAVEAAAPEGPDFSVELLEAELIQSLDEAELDWAAEAPMSAASMVRAPVAAPAPAEAPRPAEAVGAAARTGFRMPLANFHVAQRQEPPRTEPVAAAPAAIEPAAAPVSHEPEINWELPGVGSEDVVALEPPVAAAPQPPRKADASMDDLLDGVSRYELPVARTASASRQEPAFDAAIAALSTVATPFERAPAVDVSAQPARQEMAHPAFPEVKAAPASSADADEPDFDDLFGAGDFELDIEEFEQQLTELNFDEPAVAQAPKAAAIAEPKRPFADFVPETAAQPVRMEAPAAPREPVFEMPVFRQPEPDHEMRSPSVEAAAPQMPRVPVEETYQPATPSYAAEAVPADNGVFDPALLSEAEDPVEAVAEIDVPELKMPEPEEPAVVVPDYDLDIDAEMANLFGNLPPVAAQPAQPARPAEPAGYAFAPASQPPRQKAPAPVDTFDEFEKALEEDFRSMLTQPLGQADEPHLHPQVLSVQAPRRNNLRSILLAACATGVVALVGFGGYMVLTGKGGVIASGEPKIILADKGPVKVVPENKGGVTVPNQDKAVYDRVAGNEADVVKQGALVTSEEEPVDVVQKTLMPESGDDMPAGLPAATPTPVEDTQDARLLPTAQAQGNSDAVANAPGGVQVRKVRTMIVKPDGTLVPREEEPAVAEQAAQPATAAAATQAPAQETTAALPSDRLTPAGEAAAPSNAETPASADALATVANTPVASEVPVNPVKTSKLASPTPVPAARPADQPVNVTSTVTENGKVKPGQPEEAQPQQETASIDQAAAAPQPPAGSYGVQIASLPSEADAKASIPKMAAKFGNVLGGRPIGIRQANIPNKGTYYRLRVDVGSKEDAIALCTKLKAAGGSCLVSK
ncbi:SPOR domain-containing protein [Gellertiella hungarica]|uniref:SPOR domain-containing protein n=1 Tax=Gellertiella hungarica TaxID=1572859 RepID=A0A7W6NKK8_9HYPH|nr:SPOR domain-containing protein [Gellertiella hungarica]MBB4064988.1 hypothetical protein [Gellertiella hungarica]